MDEIPYIIGIGAAILVIIILAAGYVKASPDTAFIISGLRKKPKILIGKAGIKIPFFEKKDELKLQLISIDVKTSSSVPTADYINITVDAAVNVKVSTKKELLDLAAQNFLNKKTDYIAQVAREVLEGNMREIVGQMKLEEMVSDRQKFASQVKENAEPDLAGMGLEIVSFNVQNFKDGEGVIDNLGVDNIVRISKAAAISRAESERDIAVAQARARKESNDADVESQQAIAVKQNELEIKKAELKVEADVKNAQANAAYKIQEEEQRKTIETSRTNADIAQREREIELKRKEVEVKEQALDASVRKQAEAEKYALEQKAQAELFERERKAEADKYEAAQKAEAIKATGEAEAAAIRARGQAEAEAIKAKALAEAEGIDKKAEAMKKYGEAAILEMYFNALPEMIKNAAEPLSAVDGIYIYGKENSKDLVGTVMETVTQVTEGLKHSTGIDPTSILAGLIGGKLAAKGKGEEVRVIREVQKEAAAADMENGAE